MSHVGHSFCQLEGEFTMKLSYRSLAVAALVALVSLTAAFGARQAGHAGSAPRRDVTSAPWASRTAVETPKAVTFGKTR
jgi:hypothetical protein